MARYRSVNDLPKRYRAQAENALQAVGGAPVPDFRTETEWLAHITSTARNLGWMVYHTHDSRRSERGFPDLVLTHPQQCRTIMTELKTNTGKIAAEQVTWLASLGNSGIEVHVWRPRDWPEALKTLTRKAAT